MPNYSFKESLSFFADKLKIHILPVSENEEIELVLDQLRVSLSSTQTLGGLRFSIPLGLLLHPIPEIRLKELMASHFLGINTGGCTLYLDEEGASIHLKMTTSPFTSPQENWEWLHRISTIAYEWVKMLSLWDEFVPLLQLSKAQHGKRP